MEQRIFTKISHFTSLAIIATVIAFWPICNITPANAQTVTLAQGVDPESLDPALDTLISSVGVMMNIYDALIWRDANGKIVPALAESWDFPETNRMRLKIRQGVKFHDGSILTVDDVVFSYQRLFDKDSPSPLLSSLKGFVDSVEKVDGTTVLVKMPAARATVIPTLVRVPIISKSIFESVGVQAFGIAPVGTGPFKFKTWDKNERIVLERFNDHWRGPAAIERYVIRPIPEDFARFASLLNGEVDIIANLTAERVKEIENNTALKWKGVASARNMFVGMNTRNKPFDDIRVRYALNHAVDKQALIDIVMGGHAIENASVCTQTLFGATKVDSFKYDVNKSKTLLAEAGYPNGFETTLLGPVGRYTKDKEIQEAIAGMLAEVGVRVKHVQPEWAQFIKQWLGQKYPMHYIGTGNQVMDCDQHLGYRIDGKRYNRYYQSDVIDTLIQKELVEYDVGKRKAILAEIQEKLRDDAPWIFLFDLKDLYGMTARINWDPRPDEMVWAYEIKVSE